MQYSNHSVSRVAIYELKDPDLGFRGSSNQRIIDIKKTIEQTKIVLHYKQDNKENKKIWK